MRDLPFEPIRRALVIAPHPDDEVLGCGGTIARLARAGTEIVVAILTRAQPPLFEESVSRIGRAEAATAHAKLGVARTLFRDLPAARLDEVPHYELNRTLIELLLEVAPDTLFVPHLGDIHLDHQRAFASSLVAARPNRPGYPTRIFAYETLSETNWNAPGITPNFAPNLFVDISDVLELKLEAMAAYVSQRRDFPHERSF